MAGLRRLASCETGLATSDRSLQLPVWAPYGTLRSFPPAEVDFSLGVGLLAKSVKRSVIRGRFLSSACAHCWAHENYILKPGSAVEVVEKDLGFGDKYLRLEPTHFRPRNRKPPLLRQAVEKGPVLGKRDAYLAKSYAFLSSLGHYPWGQ